jgi:hypothetical protein
VRREPMPITQTLSNHCHSERALSSRALTWGPILKRSAGMGNVRASSPEESAPLQLRSIQSGGGNQRHKNEGEDLCSVFAAH